MKLRYVELPPDRIFNRLAPENLTVRGVLGKNYQKQWWEPEVIELRVEFAALWSEEYDRITGHFSKLEESIRESGIHSPISTVSGPPRGKLFNSTPKYPKYFPPVSLEEQDQVIFTQPFGGSRLTIASKLKLESVPCIVHDYSNLFPDAPEVTNTNYRNWFSDEYIFRGSPPHLVCRQFNHITKGQYKVFDMNVRRAQQQATQYAKKKLNL